MLTEKSAPEKKWGFKTLNSEFISVTAQNWLYSTQHMHIKYWHLTGNVKDNTTKLILYIQYSGFMPFMSQAQPEQQCDSKPSTVSMYCWSFRKNLALVACTCFFWKKAYPKCHEAYFCICLHAYTTYPFHVLLLFI